jgi:hypothetical protein
MNRKLSRAPAPRALSLPLARRRHRFALLLFAALCAEPAFALSETYVGQLEPTGGGTPIPIVVEIKESATFLTGKVKTSAPVEHTAEIESGRNLGGQCSFNVPLKPTGLLRLSGTCEPAGYWGIYNVRNAQGKIVAKGSFSLDRKKPEAVKDSGTHSTATSSRTTTACMTANARCLAACPRGDANAEFLCANRCRSKLQACKGQAGKQAAAIE